MKKRNIKFDTANDRLVFVSTPANQEYWSKEHGYRTTKEIISRGFPFVVNETARVLEPDAKVIDAGCGKGATVFGLEEKGFDAYGIDYDELTVAKINSIFPDLAVSVGDIHALPFDNEYFDGLWSLGVVEHFYDGYEKIINEANRVLKPGGYLFMTVPCISPLRKLKIKLGSFEEATEEDREKFFQFAFYPQEVIDTVTQYGFEFITSEGKDAATGLLDDAPMLSKLMLLEPNSPSKIKRIIWSASDIIFSKFSYHITYFLFKKPA